MRFICPMTYAIGLVLLIEFDDCESGTPCNQMREAAKLTYDSRLMLWIVLISLLVSFRLVGLFGLRQKAMQFH